MRNEHLDGSAASISAAAPCELGDDALDAMVGGMDCASGLKLAHTFITLSKIAGAVGDTTTAAIMSGRAMGVMDGACT